MARPDFPGYIEPIDNASPSAGGMFPSSPRPAGDVAVEVDPSIAAERAAAEESRRRMADAAARAEIENNPAASARLRSEAAGSAAEGALYELGRRKVSVRENKAYGPTKRYDETMLGTQGRPGLLDQTVDAQRAMDASTIARQQVVAEAMGRAADMQRQAMGRLEENQRAQAQRISDQLARVGRANELAAMTAEKFAQTPPPDRGRFWRNAPAWQKFFAGLQAAAAGWVGHPDPTAHITAAIEQDLQSQKDAIAQASQAVSDARAQSQLQGSLYHDILGAVGHEREADLVYTKAMLESAHADLVAQLENANVQVLSDGQRASLIGMQSKIAEVTKALEVESAKNVPFFVSASPYYNADQRAVLRHGATAAIDEGVAARADVTKAGMQREETKSKLQLEYDKLAAASRSKSDTDKRLESQQRMWVVAQTRARISEHKALSEWRSKYANEIPGFAWGIGWMRPKPGEINPLWGKEEEAAYNSLHRAVMIRLRAESGAAIGVSEEAKDAPYIGMNTSGMSDEQLSRAADAIIGAHNTEDGLREWVDSRIKEAKEDIDYTQRGVPDAVNADIGRSRVADRKKMTFGGDDSKTSEEWQD